MASQASGRCVQAKLLSMHSGKLPAVNHVECDARGRHNISRYYHSLQSISVLEFRRQKAGVRGPFLVVAPLTTLGHWAREIETWTPMNSVTFSGGKDDRQVCADRFTSTAFSSAMPFSNPPDMDRSRLFPSKNTSCYFMDTGKSVIMPGANDNTAPVGMDGMLGRFAITRAGAIVCPESGCSIRYVHCGTASLLRSAAVFSAACVSALAQGPAG